MNIQAPSIRPIFSAVVGFLGVTLIAMAIGLADEMGVIDPVVAKRAIGFALGLMLVVIGNSLPKLRPLHSSRAKASSAASERLSGWALVLAGSAWIVLFAFAPLNQARYIAALIGIGAVTLIAVNWAWLARRIFFAVQKQNEEPAIPVTMPAGPRRMIVYLLFAFFFVVITACVKFIIVEKQLADQLSSLMFVAFGIAYAGLFAVLEYRHACKEF
jgi:hypothetical protein